MSAWGKAHLGQIWKELAGAPLSQHFHMQRAGGKKENRVDINSTVYRVNTALVWKLYPPVTF